MQFRKPFKQAIADGRVTLSFRYWRSPQVKTGGQYRILPFGTIEVADVRTVNPADISESDAIDSGFDDLAALRDALAERKRSDTLLYRVAFHYLGQVADPRVALRESRLDDAEFDALAARMRRMDTSGVAWTAAVLGSIAEQPGTRAGDLAPRSGWATQRFKSQVRKLKAQGLTESLGVGYRLSPRGEDYIARVRGEDYIARVRGEDYIARVRGEDYLARLRTRED
jgi:hypothetical protein